MPILATLALITACPGCCASVIKIGEFGKDVAKFVWMDYVSYIKKCEKNIDSLHKHLGDMCAIKDGITERVEEGKWRQEGTSIKTGIWLKDVCKLLEKEELKYIMSSNMETAKIVVKIMEEKDLKRRLSNESWMQKVVIKVMRKLKEEIENSEEGMKLEPEEYYKKVAEVVAKMIRGTVEDLKKLMKTYTEVALFVNDKLKQSDLYTNTTIEQEMEEILREDGIATGENGDSNAPWAAAKELITPLGNWLTDLGEVIRDGNFQNAVHDAKIIELCLDTIDKLWIKTGGLKKEMDDNTKEHKGCYYCVRYEISKAAEKMTKLIKEDISNCPKKTEILDERKAELLEPPPSGFVEGMESRTSLLDDILNKLQDDGVDAVGVFGMGGIGKTTLAKEINIRAKDLFDLKVMVEVLEDTDASNIVHIQSAIAELIRPSLNGIGNLSDRAKILRSMLDNCKNKGKKILIILDNLWKKLDLNEIGIPQEACKLLFIARDKDVCRLMGVTDNDMIKVGLINRDEARNLLKSKTENQVDEEEYEDVVERLLNKCGDLPLTIVTRADELRGKGLPCWEKVADYWEMPISKQDDYKYEHTNSILERSYKLIVDENQKMFFLLAGLFPLGSSVSIESVMRYGIGLKLFEHADNLTEAKGIANTWVNELVSSSMLLEGDVQGEDFKIHMIVRAFAILFAAKEEKHKFLVDAIPGLMRDEALGAYTAMSFPSMDCCRRLSKRIISTNLQILKLRGDTSSPFVDAFFNGMPNLEVLDLSHMKFDPLPESMCELKKLRTLIMESCSLGDMSLIGNLVDLLVLSLRESRVNQLPDEIGKLGNLLLLDLSGCTSNAADISDKLSKLERVREMFDTNQRVEIRSSNGEGTSATEHHWMPRSNFPVTNESEIQEIKEPSINRRNGFRNGIAIRI